MFPGRYTLCLAARDMEGMMRFYGALGMTTHTFQHNSAMAWNGDIHLALMSFLDEHSMNFRGADPFEIRRIAGESGIEFEGEPISYAKEQFQADADGGCWVTHDPDGNNVFFDTNRNEIGEKGAALALVQILDATRRQLVNVSAPAEFCAAFEAEVVERFLTPEVMAAANRKLWPLPEPGRFPGYFTYCLKSANPEASRDWYQALGVEVATPSEGRWIHMRTSNCDLDLMSFLGENWLNFRGADVFRVYEQMQAAGLDLEGEPATYTREEYGSPGAHWTTKDPDGNVVYFDTTEEELIEPGDSKHVELALRRACEQLEDVSGDPSCIEKIGDLLTERLAADSRDS